MAASLGVRTATYILGSIAALYVFITVLLLLCACCLCYKKRKVRSVSPRAGYLSPPTSDNELEAGSSVTSSRRTSTTDISTNSSQLPNRYRRSKVKRRSEAVATCPEFEGARDSPVLKKGQAWSREKDSLSSPETYSNPRTPDSGLAPSLKDSKCGEQFPNDQATRSCTPSSLQSSSKGSSSSGDSDDVFDEKMVEAQTSSMKRSIDRRVPKPKVARTESTTPLMNDDDGDLRSPSNEREFDLPPIKERKTSSPASQDGSFFVNKSALDHEEEERPHSTEFKKQPLRELPLLNRVPSTSVGSSPMESGLNLVRSGLLPPLFPPGHSQESLNNEDEKTTAL